jgi:hypothetical protein
MLADCTVLPLCAQRTFDPDEADFFYVPVYASCYAHPIHGAADWPWWHAPEGEADSCCPALHAGCHMLCFSPMFPAAAEAHTMMINPLTWAAAAQVP